MKDKVVVDVIRQVFHPDEGASVLIRPDIETDGMLVELVVADDECSKQWYGKFNIRFEADVAMAVGRALIDAGMELKEASK